MTLITITDPVILGGLKNDWAILVAIALLMVVQSIKLILDYRTTRSSKMELRAFSERNEISRNRMEILMGNIERYMEVIAAGYNENISERQLPSCIGISVEHLKLRIGVDIANIMLHNDIRANMDTIEGKITAHVKNAFDEFEVHMSLFKFNDVFLDKYIPEGYKEHILKYSLSLILKSRSSHKDGITDLDSMSSYLRTKFDKFKSRMRENTYNNKCNG